MVLQVAVTPTQLHGAAEHMGDLSGRVGGILRKLETSLSHHGQAWGDDSYGSAFADGAQGYKAAHLNLHDGLDKLSKTLDSYSSGQHRAAVELEKQDHFR
jgi:uncharacterized protein YukE